MKANQALKTLAKSVRSAVRRVSFWPVAPIVREPDRSSLQVDVRSLVATMDADELRACADAYFASMSPSSIQCRKPFMGPVESIHICSHLGLLFEAAALFRDADVLDFGCGTGWLTIALARMGCNATGLDISPTAVGLARSVAKNELMNADGMANFTAYDGLRLPFSDETFDRIVCFDAFHHVLDQRSTIAEFARVLRPGGRVAFVEPGPNHSTTPQSQREMLQFKVIENDVSMDTVALHASASGLNPPQMLVQFQRPLRMPVDQFVRWATKGVNQRDARSLVRDLISEMTDGQCFFLSKGMEKYDSRRADGLGASMQLLEAVHDREQKLLRFRISIHNTGFARWLCSPRRYGQVRLGVKQLALDGLVLNHNLARFSLPCEEVAPGESVEVSASVPLAASSATDYCLQFDLVAEMVAWFSQQSPHSAVHWATGEAKADTMLPFDRLDRSAGSNS